jgi:hypothetical protein
VPAPLRRGRGRGFGNYWCSFRHEPQCGQHAGQIPGWCSLLSSLNTVQQAFELLTPVIALWSYCLVVDVAASDGPATSGCCLLSELLRELLDDSFGQHIGELEHVDMTFIVGLDIGFPVFLQSRYDLGCGIGEVEVKHICQLLP